MPLAAAPSAFAPLFRSNKGQVLRAGMLFSLNPGAKIAVELPGL
jgi:hypothetical protein